MKKLFLLLIAYNSYSQNINININIQQAPAPYVQMPVIMNNPGITSVHGNFVINNPIRTMQLDRYMTPPVSIPFVPAYPQNTQSPIWNTNLINHREHKRN